MPKPKIFLQQFLVGESSVENGDFTMDIDNQTVDVVVQCSDDSGFPVLVGWNEGANKDLLVQGKSKSYGIPEVGYLDGMKLSVNFAPDGFGQMKALVSVWKEVKEC